jgi:hypothetical protein
MLVCKSTTSQEGDEEWTRSEKQIWYRFYALTRTLNISLSICIFTFSS